MIPQLEEIKQTAFYAVAIFAATLVEVPARAMWQILNPLVATAVNENNYQRSEKSLSKKCAELGDCFGLVFLVGQSQ